MTFDIKIDEHKYGFMSLQVNDHEVEIRADAKGLEVRIYDQRGNFHDECGIDWTAAND